MRFALAATFVVLGFLVIAIIAHQVAQTFNQIGVS